MKWPRLQDADFSQNEKQTEVVVKGGGGHQFFSMRLQLWSGNAYGHNV